MAKGGRAEASNTKGGGWVQKRALAAFTTCEMAENRSNRAEQKCRKSRTEEQFYPTVATRNQFIALASAGDQTCSDLFSSAGRRKSEFFQIDGQKASVKIKTFDYAARPVVATHIKPQRRRKRDLAWPYVQKGLLSGAIYMVGEAISCGLLSKDGELGIHLDAFIRYSVLHSTMIGMFVNGPMLHLFFELVDRYIKFKSPLHNVVLKVLVDQIVWGCLWNFSYILLMNVATDSPGFGYIGEGLGLDFLVDLYKGITSAFWKAVDWRLHGQLLKEGLKMLPMDVICYWLVPLRLRAIWVVSVDVFWVTILSQYD